MDNEKRTGIQLSRQSAKEEVSIVAGGIKIGASEKPVAYNVTMNSGCIYILLDCSGSMRGKHKLDQARAGTINFAKDAFNKGYRVGLIEFSDDAEHLCELTSDIVLLQNKINSLNAVGSTNLAAAIIIAHLKLKDCKGTRIIVIATDGQPDSVKKSLESAGDAKNDGIDIITIGTDDADKEFLKKLATRTELSTKVASDKFAQAISDASRLLMSPKSKQIK